MATVARKVRLFFALPVEPTLAATLAPLARDVAEQTGGRAVPQENLHATLAFLGSVAHAAVAPLKSMADALPRSSFGVSLDTLGSFRQARVAWIGAAQVPAALQQMHAALILVVGGQAKQFPRIRLDAERRLHNVGNL